MAPGLGRDSQIATGTSIANRAWMPGFPPARLLRRARVSFSHSLAYNQQMANLTLVYGLRLLPSDEVAEVGAATIRLKNGRDAHVTMHVLEGSKDEIEKQLRTSLSAFFDIYPEI